MNTVSQNVENIILQDPGNRRLALWAKKGDLEPATISLYDGDHIVITTGFYIVGADAIETDGPPGALILAKALTALGKKVTIITDNHAIDILSAGAESINFNADIVSLDPAKEPPTHLFMQENTTHFISVERPGQAKDGNYYNHRSIEITKYHAILDSVFADVAQKNIVTIGIGDGGNEMGMGDLAGLIEQHVPAGNVISSQTPAKYCICAGVSNWACYGITALLSIMANKNLLPQSKDLIHLLNAIIKLGAVDGISGKPEPTVDGLDQNWELNILQSLHKYIMPYLEAASI